MRSLQVLTAHTSWSNRERFSKSFVTRGLAADLNSLLSKKSACIGRTIDELYIKQFACPYYSFNLYTKYIRKYKIRNLKALLHQTMYKCKFCRVIILLSYIFFAILKSRIIYL